MTATELRPVPLKDIDPNPFRDEANYPYSQTKIDELIASYQNTRIWPNVIARPINGRFEIAYGHHRLQAANKLYGKNYKYPLIVEDLDNDTMFKMMASENMDVYSASAQVVQNTIESLIKAYAAGSLHLKPPANGAQGGEVRYAPSFTKTRPRADAFPYTAETLRDYLGWTSARKVKEALLALETVEQGLLKREDFEGVSMRQAEGIVDAVRHAQRASTDTQRKRPNTNIVAETRRQAVQSAKRGEGRETIVNTGRSIVETKAPRITKAPLPAETAINLTRHIAGFWTQTVTRSRPPATIEAILRVIAANRNSPSLLALGRANMAAQTATALRELATTATKWADLIESDTAIEETR